MNCARWDLCGGRSVMGVSTAIARLLEQGQNALRHLVGLCNHRGARLLQNLGA